MGGIINYLKISLLSFYLSMVYLIVVGATLSGNANNFLQKSLPFEYCGSKYLMLHLNISSCSTIPCVMKRGSNVKVDVLFDDEAGVSTYITHRVRWIFNTIITKAVVAPDPCNSLQKCLFNHKDGGLYNASILVKNSFPLLSGTLIWQALNEHKEDVICFRIPIVIIM